MQCNDYVRGKQHWSVLQPTKMHEPRGLLELHYIHSLIRSTQTPHTHIEYPIAIHPHLGALVTLIRLLLRLGGHLDKNGRSQ